MYNLLIVDDEIYAVKAIAEYIDWSDLGIDNVIVAYSASGAMKKFEENEHIDAAILDVEMPGMNGIELLEWIKINYPDTECIFYTGHEVFKYVQRAMELGCKNYLLKPINYDELKMNVKNVLNIVKKRNEQEYYFETYKKNFQKYYDAWEEQRPQMTEIFWKNLLCQSSIYTKNRIASLLELYEISATPDSMVIPVMINVEEWMEELSNREEEVMEYGIRNIAKEYIGERFESYIFRDDMENMFLVICCEKDDLIPIEEINKTLQEYINLCVSNLECHVCCYVGEWTPLYEISSNYQKLLSLQRCNITKIDTVLLSDEQNDFNEYQDISFSQKYNEWTSLFESGKSDELIESVMKCVDQIPTKMDSLEYIWEIYHTVMHLIYFQTHKRGISISNVILRDDLIYDVYTLSFKEFREWLQKILQQLTQYFDTHFENNIGIINMIKDFIKDHLQNEIHREEIAKHVYLSPSYLSRIFKLETGMPLSKYIVEKRIEIAKEMLAFGSETISEVAMKVGYNNFSYFAKSFKKQEGISPQEYRKRYGKIESKEIDV